MKKYLSMAAAGLFLFSACSNDEEIINGNGSEADLTGQELVLKVASTGDGLTTRASRPLYSSEAAQAIDKVKIAIFSLSEQEGKDVVGKCVYAKEYTNWSKGDGKDYGTGTDGQKDHGKYASLNLKAVIGSGDTKGLDPGSYMVYAVGYNGATASDSSPYTFTPAMADLKVDYNPTPAFSFVKATTSTKAEEIFAGSIAKITVNDERNFDITTGGMNSNILYLHRQVAGTFGYFMNIPAAGPDGTAATHLRLVASSKNTELQMTKFNSDFRTTGDKEVQYMVNGVAGTTAATADAKFFATTGTDNDAFTVYSIKLSDWFTGTSMDVNGDGVLNGKDAGSQSPTWKIPEGMTGFNAIKGTVFGGEFVIPFLKKDAARTFELQLINDDAKGNVTILRRWTVALGKAQSNVANTADNQTIESETVGTLNYSIVRNHLYTIGRKDIANPTDPTDPTEPETPEDLSKGQILTIRVNDNWEVLNKLVVEPEV